jgi:hypothetical protein
MDPNVVFGDYIAWYVPDDDPRIHDEIHFVPLAHSTVTVTFEESVDAEAR